MSGDMFTLAMGAGFCAAGANVIDLGVVATPAVAYLVRKYGADAGVMISASHNPAKDNGIKFFDGRGFKLPDEVEDEIEAKLNEPLEGAPKNDFGTYTRKYGATEDYINFVVDSADVRLDGLTLALDCANGSSSVTAQAIFERLGANVIIGYDQPDGVNINAGCGSTQLEAVSAMVKEHGADLGLAFDGDADRILAVDEHGAEINGDQIIAALAKDMKKSGTLKKDSVVVTIMSNMGFFKAMKDEDIRVLKTTVGDRYVLEEMVKEGISIGGEQSGHVILLDRNTTGDGQMTGVALACALKKSGEKADWITKSVSFFPQKSMNVKATPAQKEFLVADSVFMDAVAEKEKTLGDQGRVIIRPSGTEAIVRIMVEAEEERLVDETLSSLHALAEERLK